MNFAAMAELCAPRVAPDTLRRIASVESSFNPYAIGVVGGRLARQPRNKAEAVATADMLAAQGWDYSVGVIQVNQKHFAQFGLTAEQALDPCTNLRVGGAIYEDCLKRAGDTPRAAGDALSCYYSGNFSTGYRLGYVSRVLSAGGQSDGVPPIPVIGTTKKVTRVRSQMPINGASQPLFVSAPTPSAGAVSTTPITKGHDTALLF
jgi:type IV secretion system protein VirB1